ncbi:MAG: ribonuclease III [Betaproteobacteria bacterium]
MPSTALRDQLGYVFRRPELLTQALTHRSHSATHNERLEFVGDSVLNCAIAVAIYQRFPQIPEGDLSRVRANLVNGDTLASIARRLNVGAAIRLGEGELRSGGMERPSIVADALEAIFGAIFLDGGFDAARTVIEGIYAAELDAVDPSAPAKDAKTVLQEWLQARRVAVPEYVVTHIGGEAHAQSFTVECRIIGLQVTTLGEGKSRRVAEQRAAAAAYATVSGSAAKQ